MAVTGQFSKFIFVCMLLQSTTLCHLIVGKLRLNWWSNISRGISIMQITCVYMTPVS